MTITKQFAEEYENIQEKRTPGPNNFSLMEYRRLPNGPPFQNYWEYQVRSTLWHDVGTHLFFFLHVFSTACGLARWFLHLWWYFFVKDESQDSQDGWIMRRRKNLKMSRFKNAKWMCFVLMFFYIRMKRCLTKEMEDVWEVGGCHWGGEFLCILRSDVSFDHIGNTCLMQGRSS